MNVFNRLMVIAITALSIPVLLVLLVASIFPGTAIRILQERVAQLQPPGLVTQLTLILVFAVLLVVAVSLLAVETRRRAPKTVRLRSFQGGEAELTADSIEQRLAYNVDRLPDVVRVHPTVKSKGKGVEVILDLETSPDVDVTAKTQEVVDVARDVVENQMGLVLEKVRVNIAHAPYPKQPAV